MAYTVIDDPSAYFQTALYSGNGGGTNNVVNDGNSDLQPDWVWVKERDATSSHALTNSTVGANKILSSNNTNEESSASAFTSFDSDGFTVGSDGKTNEISKTYVGWQWKANGGSLTTAVESGSNVGYSRQVNTTSGFAIIKYTGIGSGASVIHGLGATPSFFTVKNLGTGGWSWYTYHHKNTSSPNTENLYLNNTDGTTDMDTVWNDQYPTSTEIKLGTNGGVNADGNEYIMYAFAEKQGYSKFGSYTGNGNNDGAFIYTGMKCAWVMIKCTSEGSRNWVIYDNKRETFNEQEYFMRANSNGAETRDDGYSEIDLLSNGFKLRGVSGDTNKSSATYIYMCFASSPFVGSDGTPCTAR
jgi:hypothetical protein